MNQKLFELNFKCLLKYPEQFSICNHYSPPLQCSGFCTYCEEQNLFDISEDDVLMSHGCHSSVYQMLIREKILFKNNDPIMFLLENPGGDYGNGNSIQYNGIKKKPPVNHFYFSPDCELWPEKVEDIKNPYGDYFAYLMRKYSLGNVYITNCVKCKYNGENYNRSVERCINKWLKKEIEEFKPVKVVFFGRKAEKLYNYFFKSHGIDTILLWHPAARKSRSCIIKENDKRLDAFFK